MKNLDVYVSTAICALPGNAVTMLAPPPPDPISAAAAEVLLRKQQDLVCRGERGNMHQIRTDWASSDHHREAAKRSMAVGILVPGIDLRRAESQLPPASPCIEANLKRFATLAKLDTRDMLYEEPYWPKASGTCFLIGDDLVMTARHNICNDFGGSGAYNSLCAGDLHVVFGHEFTTNGRPRDVFCERQSLFRVKRVQNFPCAGVPDWVTLQLTEAATMGGTRTALTKSNFALTTDTPVYSLGYPRMVSQRYCYTSLPLEFAGDEFHAYLDAYDGSSGSPVLSARDHGVVGIVRQSWQPGGRVMVCLEDRFVSLLNLPEYPEKATLCMSSAAIPINF